MGKLRQDLDIAVSAADDGKVLTTLRRVFTVRGMIEPNDDDPRTDGRDAFLWPDAQKGPWLLRVAWANVRGRYECVGLEIRGYRESDETWPPQLPHWSESPEVLTASVLRQVPMGRIVDDLRDYWAKANRSFAIAAFDPTATEEEAAIDDELRVMGRQQAVAWGESRTGLTMLEDTAGVYTAAWRGGLSPTKAVAAHFTISPSAAAKRVSRARAAGLLPPTKRGTPQAYGEGN